MKKIELIWREILEKSSQNNIFEQKKLAEHFDFSTSTVHAALAPLRAIGAVMVTGRNFRVTDFEKILMFWATRRNLQKDIIYQTRVNLPVLEIEGLVDNKTIYGAYSAARHLLKTVPAEYDKVYVYGNVSLAERFPPPAGGQDGVPNFFVLKKDNFLTGKITPVSQTYVDLWNLPDWYAADFTRSLKEKFYAKFL